MWILWELNFGNVNLMRAGHWKSEFVRAGHCGYEFDEHWVLWMLINNFIIMRADHCECEFYESWALQMWILWEPRIQTNLWELSFENVDFMRAKHCECEFYESWSLRIWIYENWALWMWIL